jgi:NADH dehydrogenase/NADH:ubiquinone oxidoreductase subunit G
MKIFVNDKELDVRGDRPLIEELREAGYDIPSLCYAPDAHHEASCMVCMVRNEANDQMIPSCATLPTEGMRIDTESDDVRNLRRMSLELLLSNHKARCGTCESKEKCRLRELAIKTRAKWNRFAPLPPAETERQHIVGRLWFEPAKCIHCGLCVYNSHDGFTFCHRGFDMQIIIPEQSKKKINEKIVQLCPTGALYIV